MTACVLTMSDKGSRGERTDTSGPEIIRILAEQGITCIHAEIIPDERSIIEAKLKQYAQQVSLIITTGGTGLSPRDVTPEATRAVIDYDVAGIPEAMRAAGMLKTNRAMLSRGIAGVRGRTLIINLPGSQRAARESLEAIVDVLPHAIEKLQGSESDCGG